MRSSFAIAAAALLLGAAACKESPMAKIEAEKEAFASGDAARVRAATMGFPLCPDSPLKVKRSFEETCLAEIANAFGSKKGFVATPPDHAAAATAALLLVRDGRGDYLTHVDTWLADLKNGKGTGHDALRLAVAMKMAEAAPVVGRKIADDAAARAALKGIVGAVPGACPTYWLVANEETDPKRVPPELLPDHNACVQKDLARREGPGGTYGSGTTRALEGALSIWRETERALRMGLGNADPNTKANVEAKLAVIEPATQKIETVRVESASSTAAISGLAEAHAEAGVAIVRPRGDAGAAPAIPLRAPGP